jgi:hypothetical protein
MQDPGGFRISDAPPDYHAENSQNRLPMWISRSGEELGHLDGAPPSMPMPNLPGPGSEELSSRPGLSQPSGDGVGRAPSWGSSKFYYIHLPICFMKRL